MRGPTMRSKSRPASLVPRGRGDVVAGGQQVAGVEADAQALAARGRASRISARCSKRWPRHEPWPGGHLQQRRHARAARALSTSSRLAATAARPAPLARAHVRAGVEDQVRDAQGVAALASRRRRRRGSWPGSRDRGCARLTRYEPWATTTPMPLCASACRNAAGLVRRPAAGSAHWHLVAREDLDGLGADGGAVGRRVDERRRRRERGPRAAGRSRPDRDPRGRPRAGRTRRPPPPRRRAGPGAAPRPSMARKPPCRAPRTRSGPSPRSCPATSSCSVSSEPSSRTRRRLAAPCVQDQRRPPRRAGLRLTTGMRCVAVAR